MKQDAAQKRQELLTAAIREHGKLPSRKLQAILWDKHGLKVSHMTLARDLLHLGQLAELQAAYSKPEPTLLHDSAPKSPQALKAAIWPGGKSATTEPVLQKNLSVKTPIPSGQSTELLTGESYNPNEWKNAQLPDYAMDQRKLEQWRKDEIKKASRQNWERY